ncbi:4-(cytidine 5'-diphospho)-2-C-methyl-D-erythritol kinase [Hoylesella enoeca]|uniref:4-diphosphocytidyl-2-C-methyl-D-erythritol kinase n=1 Tax=Hoylesella enoeca TaxID=76123 RepID=A0A0S2KL09_9BACT|nr:4-(cytidine 5'-diphospho)-2-C-methyl-D-erythritol kinase [Hoylesella enoeca]ALO48787.1 4-diphosphocytidyl-2C-methyl-D-erythritol kinase [Hoylesella enoeca]
MITSPCAKINLGLNVVARRADGYHDLETIFYPIPLCDTLEITRIEEQSPSDPRCELTITGHAIEGNQQDNLVVKAFRLLARDHQLGRVQIHLHKQIPSQAGLGGGSSDAAFTLRMLNKLFDLNLTNEKMQQYAAKLGADCAFFITARPAYATGIGDHLSPIDELAKQLHNYYIVIVKPDVAISTREAYTSLVPSRPNTCCRDIVREPIEQWREMLSNDFETPILSRYPELSAIKVALYNAGAVYAQMSGSGSAFFGLFKEEPVGIEKFFGKNFVYSSKL